MDCHDFAICNKIADSRNDKLPIKNRAKVNGFMQKCLQKIIKPIAKTYQNQSLNILQSFKNPVENPLFMLF